MNDRYDRIRAALAMGPTPGTRKWWENEAGYCCVNPDDGGLWIAKCDVRDPFDSEQRANAALIAACDPDTIRALLDERDALLASPERLAEAPALLPDEIVMVEHNPDEGPLMASISPHRLEQCISLALKLDASANGAARLAVRLYEVL